MFADRKATTMIPAHDVQRAQQWYEDKLGLKPDHREDYGATYSLKGGAPAFLYESQFAGAGA